MRLFIIFFSLILFGAPSLRAQCPVITGILADACTGAAPGSNEQNNELLVIMNGNSSTVAGNIQLDLPSGTPAGIHTYGSLAQATTVVQSFDGLITNAACKSNGATPILIPASAATVIPAHATILYFPGGTFTDAPYNFNAYCGMTIYVLVSNIVTVPGSAFFSNTAPRTTTISTIGCNGGATNSYTYPVPAGGDGTFVSFTSPDNPVLAAGNSGAGSSGTSLSNNGCALPPPSVLSISLVSFTAYRINAKTVQLNWTNDNELNNDYMIVERSADGIRFSGIGQVQGSGTSSIEKSYMLKDENALQTNGYYRLKTVDLDGSFSYSRILLVKGSQSASAITLYPNPAMNFVEVSSVKAVNEITMTDAAGRTVLHKTGLNGNTEQVNVQMLPAGLYVMKIRSGNEIQFQKFVRQ